ncbi:hypothetical protein Tco_0962516 [Tanacetum coccineum]
MNPSCSLVNTNTPLYLTNGYRLRHTRCVPTTTTSRCLSQLLRCKEAWPQQPLLGLLRRTKRPRVSTIKDRSYLCIKSSSFAMKSPSKYQSSAAVKFWGLFDYCDACVPTLISQAPGPSRKRSSLPSSPFYLDATTFSDGKPASETPELNPKDDSLAAAENEIALLQIRVTDTEDRHAEDHEQI